MSALFLLVVSVLALLGGCLGWYLETKHGALLDVAARWLERS